MSCPATVRSRRRRALVPALLAVAALAACSEEDDLLGAKQEERVTGNLVVPESLGVTEQRVAGLATPPVPAPVLTPPPDEVSPKPAVTATRRGRTLRRLVNRIRALARR